MFVDIINQKNLSDKQKLFSSFQSHISILRTTEWGPLILVQLLYPLT